MLSLSFDQMQNVSAGAAKDWIACATGIAGFVVICTCTAGVATVGAAVSVIAGWTSSGLLSGVGCGRALASLQ